jgi:hypothetical protein
MKLNDIPPLILNAVRRRMEYPDEKDRETLFGKGEMQRIDERIEAMNPAQLMSKYAGWHWGDEGIARHIIEDYEELKAIEKSRRQVK